MKAYFFEDGLTSLFVVVDELQFGGINVRVESLTTSLISLEILNFNDVIKLFLGCLTLFILMDQLASFSGRYFRISR